MVHLHLRSTTYQSFKIIIDRRVSWTLVKNNKQDMNLGEEAYKELKIGEVQVETDRCYVRLIDASRAINMSKLGLDCMLTGSAFQRRIDLGRKGCNGNEFKTVGSSSYGS